jgi:Tfp pilus assembly protein PilF
MVRRSLPTLGQVVVMATLVALTCVGCAGTPKPTEPAPTPAPAPPPPETIPPPSLPAAPALSPQEAKVEAQKQTLEARDHLQNGDEAPARTNLERALLLDPSNELARELMDQVQADAQQALGAKSFAYTVQSGDSLSKLAERFLGDKMRFYILAKYNGIANPSKLAAGQVVKIPGTKPPSPPQAQPARPKEPSKGAELTKPPGPAAKTPEPSASEREQAERNERERQALVQRYNREAMAAYHKQDLDTAIKKWDQVLQLDPDNETAKYSRARALDLKERLQKFPAQKQ